MEIAFQEGAVFQRFNGKQAWGLCECGWNGIGNPSFREKIFDDSGTIAVNILLGK